MRYARGEKTVEHKNVNLKLDKLAAGPYALIVASQDDAALEVDVEREDSKGKKNW